LQKKYLSFFHLFGVTLYAGLIESKRWTEHGSAAEGRRRKRCRWYGEESRRRTKPPPQQSSGFRIDNGASTGSRRTGGSGLIIAGDQHPNNRPEIIRDARKKSNKYH
jgi:hypothetical protein